MCNVLLETQIMVPQGSGDLYSLVDATNSFTLIFQEDQNLCLYPLVNGQYQRPALWTSNTQGKGGTRLELSSDGVLNMTGPNGVIWTSGQPGAPGIHELILQKDGNLVIYKMTAVWDREGRFS